MCGWCVVLAVGAWCLGAVLVGWRAAWWIRQYTEEEGPMDDFEFRRWAEGMVEVGYTQGRAAVRVLDDRDRLLVALADVAAAVADGTRVVVAGAGDGRAAVVKVLADAQWLVGERAAEVAAARERRGVRG